MTTGLVGYRFYIPSEGGILKPFLNGCDRRMLSIQKSCNCEIRLTQEARLKRGQKVRAVIVTGHDKNSLESCLRRLDDTFPRFYACANLQSAKSALKIVELKRYLTDEDLAIDKPSTPITYYQLAFNLDRSDIPSYEIWRQGSDASLIKKLGCSVVVSSKDTPGTGFLRRYALITGENKKAVIRSYDILRSTFTNLPEYTGDG
ncbi:hypothetical protein AAHC03_01929 [Spirometra sp. Aus1]